MEGLLEEDGTVDDPYEGAGAAWLGLRLGLGLGLGSGLGLGLGLDKGPSAPGSRRSGGNSSMGTTSATCRKPTCLGLGF